MESNKLGTVENHTALEQPELIVDGATALAVDDEAITREQRRSRRKRERLPRMTRIQQTVTIRAVAVFPSLAPCNACQHENDRGIHTRREMPERALLRHVR